MLVFGKHDLEKGKKLLAHHVTEILFSEGTYQVEVLLERPKESVWPFLQIDDHGEILDAFCTCEEAEKKGKCAHLAAAYLKIMGEKQIPLHVRFRDSIWNHIGLMCAEQLGYDPKILKKEKASYKGLSKTGTVLISLTPLNARGERKINEILFQRPLQTEETSLKFSNLSFEEITLWREGRPSQQLRYELCFWSDLAKWWMLLQEAKKPYTIEFSEEIPPASLKIKFSEILIEFSIDKELWPELIPSLSLVHSPLKVFTNGEEGIKAIRFLRDRGEFQLEFAEKKPEITHPHPGSIIEKIGNWLYVPKKGFYPKQVDPMLESPIITKDKVSDFFSQHLKIIQKLLKEDQIHPSAISPRYNLAFDHRHDLWITPFLFGPDDLRQEGAHYFKDWVYLPHKGFFKLENQVFFGTQWHIPKEEIADFINKHRVFLQGIEGFQTHVSGVESHLSYRFNQKGNLEFYTRIEFTEEAENIIDLGEWIYVKGRGFYAKVSSRPGSLLQAGIEVSPSKISSFINEHQEELSSIQGFFSKRCPVEKIGLNIHFNSEGRIEISPQYVFAPKVAPEKVRFFGDYTYMENEGFYLIPQMSRLPESYRVNKVIDPISEPYFVGYELELLYPFVFSIDPKLKRPKQLILSLVNLKREPRAKTGQWISEFHYKSEVGEVPLYDLWKGITQNKPYLFTNAGLIFLRNPRFDFLRTRTKKQWLHKEGKIRLNTMDFLRLLAMETIEEPQGEGVKDKRSRALLYDFLSLKAPTTIDLTGLKSDLRTYQKTGVAWLFFLHAYGLSGLLCDEMGLGKTHQAMALIAGIKNLHKEKKARFLVVCPTSVIYHWEELIKQFLPDVRVYVFHGGKRRLDTFVHDGQDLLLTSYGIARSENKALSQIHFDLAIFDELQVAKNEKSLTHRALKNISANMHLGLSGTPIENRLVELKALFDIILPGYLPSMSVFRETFVHPIEKYGNEEKRKLLHRLIHPFLLRRKKSEVLTELPEKIEEIAYCDLSEEQETLYQEIYLAGRKEVFEQLQNENKPAPVIHIFSLLTKLKQVCDHPCLILGNPKEYKKHTSGKWELFVELLDEVRDSGQKLVIFSQYLDMLDIIEMHLQEHKIGFTGIRGATRDRGEIVKKFNNDPTCEVFVGSLQAAGVGIDLMAASVVIHYDRWWNPAKENQATDRVHRIGQKRGVQVFKLVTKNTVEEHIHALIEEKLGLAEKIVGFDSQEHIKGLSREELLGLMRLLDQDLQKKP